MRSWSPIVGEDKLVYYEAFDLVNDKAVDDNVKVYQNYAWRLERKVKHFLEQAGLVTVQHPSGQHRMFGIELDPTLTEVLETPLGTKKEAFRFVKFTTQHMIPRTEKPSGLIFEDYSYLQIQETIAWRQSDRKLYLAMYAYHYGRTTVDDSGKQKDRYYFRYEKESDWQFDDQRNPENVSSFKPLYHFHGNAKNPHFPEPRKPKEISEVIELIANNLSRWDHEFGACQVGQFPDQTAYLR